MHQCSYSMRGGLKHLILIIFIVHRIVFYGQNISLIFYIKDGSHVRLWHPSCVYITAQRAETVHCSTKDVYTSEITFLALHPCMEPGFTLYWLVRIPLIRPISRRILAYKRTKWNLHCLFEIYRNFHLFSVLQIVGWSWG